MSFQNVYYVTYAYERGYGWGTSTRRSEITTVEEVEQMAEYFAEAKGYSQTPVILSWQLLRIERIPEDEVSGDPSDFKENP